MLPNISAATTQPNLILHSSAAEPAIFRQAPDSACCTSLTTNLYLACSFLGPQGMSFDLGHVAYSQDRSRTVPEIPAGRLLPALGEWRVTAPRFAGNFFADSIGLLL